LDAIKLKRVEIKKKLEKEEDFVRRFGPKSEWSKKTHAMFDKDESDDGFI